MTLTKFPHNTVTLSDCPACGNQLLYEPNKKDIIFEEGGMIAVLNYCKTGCKSFSFAYLDKSLEVRAKSIINSITLDFLNKYNNFNIENFLPVSEFEHECKGCGINKESKLLRLKDAKNDVVNYTLDYCNFNNFILFYIVKNSIIKNFNIPCITKSFEDFLNIKSLIN